MLKYIYLIPLFIFQISNVLYAQTNPFDTTYYSNGMIKRICFKHDKYLTGETCCVTYSAYPEQASKLGQRLADTLHKGSVGLQKIYTARLYYPENISVEKYVFYDQSLQKTRVSYYDIKYFYKQDSLLSFRFGLFSDSSLSLLSISVNNAYTNVSIKSLNYIPLKKGSGISELNSFDLGIYGTVGFEFGDKGILQKMIYKIVSHSKIRIFDIDINENMGINEIQISTEDSKKIYSYRFYPNVPLIKEKGTLSLTNGAYEKLNDWAYFDFNGKERK